MDMKMKVTKSFDEEVDMLICDDCYYSFWIQTLFGPHRFILNQIVKICPYCGGRVQKMTEEEYKKFVKVREEE